MTKDKIKFYQDEIIRYLELFGCGQWAVKWYDWSETPAEFQEQDACISYDVPGRLASFSVNPEEIKDKADTWISRSALHESTHVLTSILEYYAKTGASDALIEAECEAIARSLEKMFFGMVDM